MLTTLDQPISSPRSSSSSPRFAPYQHVSPTLRVITTTSRRKSYIPDASPALRPAPTRGVVHYVDRGTQYSPLIVKSNMSPSPLGKEKGPGGKGGAQEQPQPPRSHEPQENTAPSDADADAVLVPPAASKPLLEGDSPSMKKRSSPHEIPPSASSDTTLPAKRAKEAQPAVKLLPTKYELCEVGDIVVLIANMISELIETNDGLPLRDGVLTRFHSRTPPGISVLDYLQRLAKHATLTPPLLLSMVYYIDRLCSLYPAFTINTLTVHRFLITAATVAAKGLSDSFWNNATYARVGGIRIAELGMLELEFLYRVDWKIVPNPEVLVDYYRGLVERSVLYELADDRISDDDDEGDSDDIPSPEDTESKAAAKPIGGATDVKWQAWMDDVSKEKAEHGEAMDKSTA